MLIKCKICKRFPADDFKQTEPAEDGTPYSKIIDENLYFLIINGEKIAFCSPQCATKLVETEARA